MLNQIIKYKNIKISKILKIINIKTRKFINAYDA